MATTRIRGNVDTQDITQQFRHATSRVPSGTLVKESHFSLFEAVGGIEIGDPKMDSGCLMENEDVEDDFDVTQDLLPEELLWLMDRLVCTEVAWLMGHPLSQTLFTSLFVEKLLWPVPKTLDDATFVRGYPYTALPKSLQFLRAFCLCLLKSSDVILSTVTAQHFYEEEDFTTQLFNRELLRDIDHNAILDYTETMLADVSNLSDSPVMQQALQLRLQFRYNVLEFVIHNAKGISCSANDKTIKELQYLISRFQNTSNGSRQPVTAAFSTKLQRRLASTVPPRPMVVVEFDRAWQFWDQLVLDVANCFDALSAMTAEDMLTAYAALAFGRSELSAYPRALLQSFLEMDNKVGGRCTGVHFLEQDLKSLTMPGSPLFDPNLPGSVQQEAAQKLAQFSIKFEQTFVNLYRALCLNRCRIRRTFCHAILEWDRLQPEVEQVDAELQTAMRESPIPYPPGGAPTHAFAVSSWIYHHKLTVVRLTIQMGFQQSIYAPHEHAKMYWYLSSICDTHLSHLERISYFVSKRAAEVSHLPKSDTGRVSSSVAECKNALQRLYQEFIHIKAVESLAKALHAVFIILSRRGANLHPHPTYSDDTLRYEIRMRPFLNLSIPECPSYESLERQVAIVGSQDSEVLDKAGAAAAAAKKGWEELLRSDWNRHQVERPQKFLNEEAYMAAVPGQVIHGIWKEDLQRTIKATIATSLAIIELRNFTSADRIDAEHRLTAELPEEGQSDYWHRWWIVPRIR